MMADSKVSARVQELRAKLENKALWTREMSVRALVSAYKIAQGANSASGMTGAVKELNAMHGFYPRPEKDLNDGDVASSLSELATRLPL